MSSEMVESNRIERKQRKEKTIRSQKPIISHSRMVRNKGFDRFSAACARRFRRQSERFAHLDHINLAIEKDARVACPLFCGSCIKLRPEIWPFEPRPASAHLYHNASR